MKLTLRILLIICVIAISSCRDTKEDEQPATVVETKAEVEEVKKSEQMDIEAINQEIQKDVEDLEDALNDLDNI